ncbi:universal stress protein [Haloarchaeobius iranensis]|uniref:Nucleotide-binding universal stress protein, UspA family n=1 Tax=Haloarchaeobius iranensis TaxID=996166 RepID=A0A1G9YRB3_9EURY|nr:universal stress protein [Haloarchaeobius iranensis]SDN11033.1 Nucleotide-binding universal stress protein, UspA family [Haloarchaeobius iranensis]
MYDRILLPTDGDSSTTDATRHAIELAAATGATLTVLYVVDEDVYGAYPGDEYVHDHEGAESGLEEAGREALDAVAEEADDAGVTVETVMEYGHPHEEILDTVAENGADLVVMGTKSRSGEYRQLLGSVTDRVVRLCDVPVTVVKTETD